MSLALSIRRARASASIFSSAWKFSTRIRRTTSRARVSSRTSASLRPTSRLTTASDIRPATSSLRAMHEETGYTDANRGVKHNYPENRSKLAVEAGEKQAKPGAFPGQALDLDAATVGLGEGLHEAEAEPQTPSGRRLRMGDPHVLVEDAGQLLSRDADAIGPHPRRHRPRPPPRPFPGRPAPDRPTRRLDRPAASTSPHWTGGSSSYDPARPDPPGRPPRACWWPSARGRRHSPPATA